jgi:hypothetical protein
MNFFLRLFKFFRGVILFLRYNSVLNLNDLIKGKRIAIIGPADSSLNTGKGEYINGFDFVVRLNKAPNIIGEGKWDSDIGSKTDILFHSFFENEKFGGGPLRFELYDRLGIQYVINPLPTFFGYRNSFNYYKKYLENRVVYTLPRASFIPIKKSFKKYRPTTGFCALYSILNSDFSELYISGFTFFKTNYVDGYRDSLQKVEGLRKTMDSMKIHNPDIEFHEFLKLLSQKRGRNIFMDSTLTTIVENETQPQK